MIKIHLVRLLTEDENATTTETSQHIWGKTKFEIMQRCRRKNKLLPSSAFCRGTGNRVWTNVFRAEKDFKIKTGKCK
jgi:hypothetical protein